MATKHGPNLEAGRRAVEKLMDDTCEFKRPVDADTEEVDPTTLEIVQLAAVTIYVGKCAFAERGDTVPTADQVGLAIRNIRYYHVSIPLSAPRILVGDVCVARSSRRDPQLPGTQFVVTTPPPVGTLTVSRQIMLERL